MGWPRRAERLARSSPPVVVDGAIALGILAVATIEWLFSYEPSPVPHKGLGLALLVVAAAGLTVRRKNLLAAFILVEMLPIVGLMWNVPVLLSNGAFLMELIVLYTVAEQCGGALAALAVVAELMLDYLAFRPSLPTGILLLAEGDTALIVIVWFAGRAQSRRRAVAARLEQTASELRKEREGVARAAVAAERTRIARELHELVVRGVKKMNSRTEIAHRRLTDGPDSAAPAIEAIEEAGRETLVEMRRLLVLLRAREEEPA